MRRHARVVRNVGVLGMLALVAPWLMGMGGGGDNNGKTVPLPQKNFTVSITDGRGQKATAERFTWEGKVSFQGQYGSATITVPFQKVQSVKVMPSQAGTSPTTVLTKMTLRGGDTLDLGLDRTSKCYGETSFGTYEIFLKDVGEIQFQ
jgi:hypothetical protein